MTTYSAPPPGSVWQARARQPDPGFWQIALAYAISEGLVLRRMRTPIAFMIIMPAVLSLALGPAISGSDTSAFAGQSMIGVAVMFSFMTVNYVGLAFFREFDDKTWTCQSISRPPRVAFVVGKTVPVALAGMGQLTIFGLVAYVVLGTPLRGPVLQPLTVAVGLVCVGCALGAALYTVTRTTSVFQSLAYMVLVATGCVGGAVVPYPRLPRFSQFLGWATPQHWALRALHESSFGSGSWWPTLQATGVMLGMAVLLAAASLPLLNYRKEKSAL